jgi:4Fe-4S ferredoxin
MLQDGDGVKEVEMKNEGARKVSPVDLYKYLPKENCGECGTRTCMGFAVRLLKRESYLADCPRLDDPMYITAKIELKKLLAEVFTVRETKLVIYGDLCNGCGNCVIVCPPNASCSIEASGGKGPLTDEVVMDIGDGVVVELNLSSCRRITDGLEVEPCRLCIDACPFNAIEFM